MHPQLISSRYRSDRVVAALALFFGLGCGGSSCGVTPLPSTPTPTGFPMSQQIEGGMQVRVTKPGFDKLSSMIPALLGAQVKNGVCATKETTLISVLGQDAGLCNQVSAACGGQRGCPAYIYLNSAERPSPYNHDDGKDKIVLSMANGTNPQLIVDMSFDFYVPLVVWYDTVFTSGDCTVDIGSEHRTSDSAEPVHVIAKIGMSTDATTGELKLNLDDLTMPNPGLDIGGSCLPSWATSALSSFINSQLGTFLVNAIIGAIRPTLNSLIQGFLPKPPGLAGILPTGQMLASLGPPDTAALETYMVAGGYVTAYNGGLNLGVISGMNSDRDTKTRSPSTVSEPSLCVPIRPAPKLGGAPWNLKPNTARPDFILDVANEFAGKPDPKDMTGKTKDLAIGVSRTFLDLAGFHAYSSGTLCLAISGGVLAALNTGALSVLIPSLGNIVDNRKAPLALVLRPQQPLTFTIGTGTMTDSLLHINITDMRIDFYAFIEERYVRIFTLAADMNVGVNLAVTKDMNGKPAIQPMVTGIDKMSVMMRVSNTDLIQEDPKKLAVTLKGLIDIAVGQLMGAIKPIALPSLMGFSLDGLEITRVQTAQDNFLAIFGTLVQDPMGMAYPAADWVPSVRSEHAVSTKARIVDVSTPPGEVIRNAVLAGDLQPGSVPSVTLALSSTGAPLGSELEYSVRIDHGGWQPWSRDAHPTLADPSFQLQAKHTIDVRSRVAGDWLTEDPSPVALEVVIDSEPPLVQTRVEKERLVLDGRDNVSSDEALRWSWMQADGTWTTPGYRSSLSLDEAWTAAGGGKLPFQVAVYDELGNRAQLDLDLKGIEQFHGRTTTTTTGGCGCDVAGQHDAGVPGLALLGLPLALLLLVRRRRHAIARNANASLIVLAVVVGFVAGACNCGGTAQSLCKLDDECRMTKCDTGQIGICSGDGTCGCTSDVQIGDIGRYSSMAMRGGIAYVAAYNTTYGDLMIGNVGPPGVVKNWEFVDGIPEDAAPDNPLSQVRGGVTEKGDDVGRYASIAVNPTSRDPIIAYYDVTHGALKLATFGAVRWHNQIVDKGMGLPTTGGDDFGRFASMTLDKTGAPGIAYYAEVARGASGKRESQLRFAQANRADPTTKADWTITVVETRVMPVPPTMNPPIEILPNGIALFCASARRTDDSPVVAYYDRERGNLRYAEYDAIAKKWKPVVILDGEDGGGGDTADAGMYPSVAVDGMTVHISYVDAKHDNLLYVNTKDKIPEVIDDGYRPKEEMTLDGIDSPVYHLVGDSSSIQVAQGVPLVAYQDSTVEQLRLALRDPMTKKWSLTTVAGHGSPFKGAYGFYAQARIAGGVAVLSSYGINQHQEVTSFFVETFAFNLGTIM